MRSLFFKNLLLGGIILGMFSCNSGENIPEYPVADAGLFVTQQQDDLLIDPNSEELTVEDAVNVADIFMKRENISTASRVAFSNYEIKESFPIEGDEGSVVAYVVNYAPSGFAIVSATKKYSPILAFSDEGQITQEAIDDTGLGWWIQCISDEISKAKAEIKEKTPEYAQVRGEWQKYERAESVRSMPETGSTYDWYLKIHDEIMSEGGVAMVESDNFYYQAFLYGTNFSSSGLKETIRELDRKLAIVFANEETVPPSFVWGEYSTGEKETKLMPLLKTYWNQNEPYNLLLPLKDGNAIYHKPAGCVAIATSQILNYHAFPPVLDGTMIDWTQTQVKFAGKEDTEIKRLVKVVNVGVKTKNGNIESPAFTSDARQFLQRNNYQANVYTSDLETIVTNEIKSHRPVYMEGKIAGASTGHAWVCDGLYSIDENHKIIAYLLSTVSNEIFTSNPYKVFFLNTRAVHVSNYFHMNWGWGEVYADESDPSEGVVNSTGWFYSIFDVEYNNNMGIMQIIPNK